MQRLVQIRDMLVVAVDRQRVLDQVVGPDREEIDFGCEFIRQDGGRRDLDHHAHGHVAPGGRVYIEHGAAEALPELPAGWRLEKNARAGNVRYHLAVVGPAPAAS